MWTKLTRREVMLAGLGLALAGCAEKTSAVFTGTRPGAPWPMDGLRPTPTGARIQTTTSSSTATAEPEKPHAPIKGIKPLPRLRWAKASPITSRMNPMNGIERITVHHEGWTPVHFSDVRSTAERLETIRAAHLERMTAGDIGYHYIIDRAGRIWQGRDLRYQGAHVKDQNEHNIGVMVMGNFDVQSPTRAQYATLQTLLTYLMHEYNVPRSRVFTHQELGTTHCPGTALQKHMVELRRNGLA